MPFTGQALQIGKRPSDQAQCVLQASQLQTRPSLVCRGAGPATPCRGDSCRPEVGRGPGAAAAHLALCSTAVGHAAVLLLLAPQLGHKSLSAQEHPKAPHPVLPLLQRPSLSSWVDEDVTDEFPQVGASGGYKAKLHQSAAQAPVSSPAATWPSTQSTDGCPQP